MRKRIIDDLWEDIAMSTDPKSNYYDQGGIETIDIISAKLTQEQLRGYLLGNCIKYACRLMWKSKRLAGRKRDAEKLQKYSDWLLRTYELEEK